MSAAPSLPQNIYVCDRPQRRTVLKERPTSWEDDASTPLIFLEKTTHKEGGFFILQEEQQKNVGLLKFMNRRRNFTYMLGARPVCRRDPKNKESACWDHTFQQRTTKKYLQLLSGEHSRSYFAPTLEKSLSRSHKKKYLRRREKQKRRV